jgi:hypothetical protein
MEVVSVQVVLHTLPLQPRLMPQAMGAPALQLPVALQVLSVSAPLVQLVPHGVPEGG